jgi:hypothetical protein
VCILLLSTACLPPTSRISKMLSLSSFCFSRDSMTKILSTRCRSATQMSRHSSREGSNANVMCMPHVLWWKQPMVMSWTRIPVMMLRTSNNMEWQTTGRPAIAYKAVQKVILLRMVSPHIIPYALFGNSHWRGLCSIPPLGRKVDMLTYQGLPQSSSLLRKEKAWIFHQGFIMGCPR